MSDSDSNQAFVSRLENGAIGKNTLNLPPAVPVRFQRSPGFPIGSDRGISGLEFQVRIDGAVKQKGVTGADGLINVRVPPGGSSLLQFLSQGKVVAEYEVSVDDSDLEAVTTLTGQQKRLRMLGYQIGHDGPSGDGTGANASAEFERGLMDFQVDAAEVEKNDKPMADGRTVKRTQDLLVDRAGS